MIRGSGLNPLPLFLCVVSWGWSDVAEMGGVGVDVMVYCKILVV